MDFSKINLSLDLTEAHETLTKFLNSSLETFYGTYAAYLGGDFANLCRRKIGRMGPNLNLWRCALSVRHAIEQDERLAGIKGIYVLANEYDALPNYFLESPENIGGPEIDWRDTAVGRTFEAFWTTTISLGSEGNIRRVFITGISPFSLSSLDKLSIWTRNLTFYRDVAGLCGLTYSDLEDALKEIYKDPEAYNGFLSELTNIFNGYHFCECETVETVYDTETCLEYLQRLIERKTPEARDLENSEVSEQSTLI